MSHVHPGYGDVAYRSVAIDGCEEIGAGVCIRPSLTWRSDRGETKADARTVGYVIAHVVGDDEVRCEGATMTELGFGPTEIWTQTGTLEGGDLTLAPSIVCRTHPAAHGFVRDGKWVPA